MSRAPMTKEVSDKGLLHGKCNRTACMNRPATWYSSIEKAHYCQPCAFKINDALPPGLAKLVRVDDQSCLDDDDWASPRDMGDQS